MIIIYNGKPAFLSLALFAYPVPIPTGETFIFKERYVLFWFLAYCKESFFKRVVYLFIYLFGEERRGRERERNIEVRV